MMIKKILQLLVTFGASEKAEPEEPTDGGGFYDEYDKQEQELIAEHTEDKDEGEPEDPDAVVDEANDETEDEESEVESEEEEAESEDEDESGDGGDANDPAVMALKSSVRSRLAGLAQTMQSVEAGSFQIEDIDADAIRKLDGMEELEEQSFKDVMKVVNASVKGALGAFSEKHVKPLMQQQSENARAARVQANINAFSAKYPGLLSDNDVTQEMLAEYNALEAEFSRDVADTATLEELYLMTGRRLPRASSPGKRAKAQKRKALKGQNQAGRTTKTQTGGKRKRDPKVQEVKDTMASYRQTRINPFSMD